MSHYFKTDYTIKENKINFTYTFNDQSYTLVSNSGMFSPGHVDYATNILLNNLPELKGSLLDLGCGYGIIGIVLSKHNNLSKVTMADSNLRALECAKENCRLNNVTAKIIESDSFSNITEKFDNIVTNPPIHAGKKTLYKMYEEAFEHLYDKGKLFIVIQKKHGAETTIDKLLTIFNNCTPIYKKKGFYILCCIKQSSPQSQ
jgi:16S rRNA (guanine1207-N2)-methyltransferase